MNKLFMFSIVIGFISLLIFGGYVLINRNKEEILNNISSMDELKETEEITEIIIEDSEEQKIPIKVIKIDNNKLKEENKINKCDSTGCHGV